MWVASRMSRASAGIRSGSSPSRPKSMPNRSGAPTSRWSSARMRSASCQLQNERGHEGRQLHVRSESPELRVEVSGGASGSSCR